MSTALCIVTDGRDYLRTSYHNWCMNLDASHFSSIICVDDSANPQYAELTEALMPDVKTFIHHETRRGLAKAVQSGWEAALQTDARYVLWLEDDFLFNQKPPLDSMRFALDRMPELSQVVLKRQPWSVEEKAAGGIIEMHPDLYEPRGFFGRNLAVTVHRRIFSLNPCLIPRRVLEMGWPDGNEAEMTDRLNEDPANLFAFLGAPSDPPLVEHVGAVRSPQWSV